MNRSTKISNSRTIPQVAALLTALACAPALAQVKAGFPGPHRADSPTPLQRSFPTQPAPPAAPGPTPVPVQFPIGAMVGGSGFTHGGGGTDGSGLFVNGSFTDNNLNVDFHLGSQPLMRRSRIWFPNGTWCDYPFVRYRGWYGPNYYDGYYDNSNQRYAVIDGALVEPMAPAPAAPAQPAAPPPPPPTDAELGALLLKAGDFEGAIDKFRASLRDNAADAEVMRALAVALLLKGEPDQGVAMMSLAYRTDEALAERTLPESSLFKSDADLRKTLQKSVTFANKIKSASAWLTVAVLMQAERRDDHALRMIDRAADLGLDADLAKRFKIALGG